MSTTTTDKIATETTKTQPVVKYFDKGVSVAIFPKVIKKDDGSEFKLFNTVIEARYKDKAGIYQSTNWFSEEQLSVIEDFAREARQAIRQQRTMQKESK